MEKVKVTEEQADAIVKAVASLSNKDNVLKYHSENDGLWHSYIHALDGMDISKLAKALYIGYEVEPELKVGDWVYHNEQNIGRITKIEDGIICTDIPLKNGRFVNTVSIYFRHATPEEIKQEKERRWWAKHDRKPWELRKGDMLIDSHGNVHEVTQIPDDFGNRYYLDYVSMNFVEIQNKHSVLVFVENRLDVSVDE